MNKVILLVISCVVGLTACGDSKNEEKEIKKEVVLMDAPSLSFTDLISGSSIGLGDGKGSGSIVTAWGFNLGIEQGTSKIEFCDLNDLCVPMSHVYYWKNADGELPSSPANLYESHGLQEIAFSIPESVLGLGEIKITTLSGESTLPFTVREGNIYHVMNTGDDDLGDGSFENPYLTIEKADSIINAGSTLYVHDVVTGSELADFGIYNNRGEAMSTLEAQYAYVSYPNTRSEVIASRGFGTYRGSDNVTAGFVVSKFAFYSSDSDEDENGQPINKRKNVSYGITGTRDGRAVGNFITDEHPSDLNGACPDSQQAAITAGSLGTDKVSNFKIIGNHIKDYGCKGTSRFHHTMYLTIRSAEDNEQLVAPEMAWNYLQDNKAISGLHFFDENHSGEDCGQFITPFNIHDNVVVNQSGAGIAFGANCPVNTTFNYYNNIIINAGLKADFDDEVINGSITSAVAISVGHDKVTSILNFDNNIFYKWNDEDQTGHVAACVGFSAGYDGVTINWNNNVCYTDKDYEFVGSNYLGDRMEYKINGDNNAWYSGVDGALKSIVPFWDNNPVIADPLITISDNKVIVSVDSPLRNRSASIVLKDVYGKVRGSKSTIGAVE